MTLPPTAVHVPEPHAASWPATAYTVLVLLVAAERLAELVVARRNAAWSTARGGTEYGRGHYPVMVALHTGLLAGCLAETWWGGRAFVPALGGPMLLLALGAQALRWWCVRVLGPRWNTRVIVVPGLPLVEGGPYRLMDHPNYLAVLLEGLALPLVLGCWITALCFTPLNLALLAVRLRCENAALRAGPALAAPVAAP
ncbi:isoprenylcysteine carboxyl methyltransferase family protein [Actinacidiphila yeochonensis]|uniref:isoprenylcysteine carboxyl methyltransferase family protein n=1 Tax=Actinacidiphila yeochonensis TaxID=89050 RepID=UPI00099BFAA5|nr:isoprenylcysteine carboxylmethyltransferase family protein [Actinacidiphila yeochonensis]